MISEYAYRKEWYTQIIEDPESYRTEPFRMCGNLYFVGTKDSATHLVDTGKGLIIFDTGYPHMQDFLFDSIKQLGFSLKDIRLIFHTHGHFDHFGATWRLQYETGAKACISRIDGAMLEVDPGLALCHYLPGIRTEFFTPDELLDDRQVITLGNTKVRCLLTPGHTPGAMSYEITVADGDREYKALLCAGVGFNTLNRNFIDVYHVNWRPAFERSLTIWKSLTPDIFLGNHTPQSKTLERHAEGRSFVDREAWPAYIAQIEENYHRMLQQEG